MSDAIDRWSTHWDAGHQWALILAAGEGSRLQALTTTASGIAVPKQFCAFGGGVSLLHSAIERARSVLPVENICTVVADQHREWWQALPLTLPERNIVVQPRNRGTANGILLPLLQILHLDAEATLLVLPSDHYVRNETVLATSLHRALQEARASADRLLLLGFDPDEADPELGYIVPVDGKGPAPREVLKFVEKPDVFSARALIDKGGLWNAFIFAVKGRALLRAFERRCPEIVIQMRRVFDRRAATQSRWDDLVALYEKLPTMDFSRDVVECGALPLDVLSVPACGWSDLGTPARLAQAAGRSVPNTDRRPFAAPHTRGLLDLQSLLSQSPLSAG